MNVCWHGHYLKYFEIGRAALLRAFDYDYREMQASGYLWPIVEAHLKYVRPATYGQQIEVRTQLLEYENRLKIGYEIVDRRDRRAADARAIRSRSRSMPQPGACSSCRRQSCSRSWSAHGHDELRACRGSVLAWRWRCRLRRRRAARERIRGQDPALVSQIAAHLAASARACARNSAQTQTLAAMKQPLVSTGSLLFFRERGVIWQIDTPYKATYVITDAGVARGRTPTASADALAVAATTRAASAQVSRMMRAMLGGDLSALYSQFDVQARWHAVALAHATRRRTSRNSRSRSRACEMNGGDYLQACASRSRTATSRSIDFTEQRGGERTDRRLNARCSERRNGSCRNSARRETGVGHARRVAAARARSRRCIAAGALAARRRCRPTCSRYCPRPKSIRSPKRPSIRWPTALGDRTVFLVTSHRCGAREGGGERNLARSLRTSGAFGR